MKILAMANQKGGVAKTTTTFAVGAGLAHRGYRVLFVDLDAQGNLSSVLEAASVSPNAHDVLRGKTTANQAICHAPGGDVIASDPALAGIDAVLTQVGKEYRLREALEEVQGLYDYAIIDTPPALGILTVNALAACHGCIVPAQADIHSMQGIVQLNDTIQTVKKYCNPYLEVMGIVLTRYNSRTVISRESAELIEQTAAEMGSRLYATRIRECTALKETHALRTDIFSYAPNSNAAADYSALVDEILKKDVTE